jgi:hypothetical protein
LGIDGEKILPRTQREKYLALPDTVEIRGREIDIRYDAEETPEGLRAVARLHLPEKIARTLTEQELPQLDRPLRFVVPRGARGAARANDLDALREELDRPFTDEEIAALDRDMERAHSGDPERRRGPRTPYGGTARSERASPRHRGGRSPNRGGKRGARHAGGGRKGGGGRKRR